MNNDHGGARRYPKKVRKAKPCLKCDRKFMSEGIYNRLCPNCRAANENVSERIMDIYK